MADANMEPGLAEREVGSCDIVTKAVTGRLAVSTTLPVMVAACTRALRPVRAIMQSAGLVVIRFSSICLSCGVRTAVERLSWRWLHDRGVVEVLLCRRVVEHRPEDVDHGKAHGNSFWVGRLERADHQIACALIFGVGRVGITQEEVRWFSAPGNGCVDLLRHLLQDQ